MAKRTRKPKAAAKQMQSQKQSVIVNIHNKNQRRQRSAPSKAPRQGGGRDSVSIISRPIEMLVNSSPYYNPINPAPPAVVNTIGALPAMFNEPTNSSVLTMTKSSPIIQPKSVDDENTILRPNKKSLPKRVDGDDDIPDFEYDREYKDETEFKNKNPAKPNKLSSLITELIESPIYKKQQGVGGGGVIQTRYKIYKDETAEEYEKRTKEKYTGDARPPGWTKPEPKKKK